MKNLTKVFAYFFFFLMLNFVACKSSTTVEPSSSISLVGKWKVTAESYSPMPKGYTQKEIDADIVCNKNVVIEFTAKTVSSSGKDCSGFSVDFTFDYTISGSKITSYGTTSDFTLSGNTLIITDNSGGTAHKTTYTRL
jgi:hypothetical protein